MRSKIGRSAGQIMLPVALLVGWWFWSEANNSFFFPPLSVILHAFESAWVWERVGSDIIPSLQRLLAGFATATLAGVMVGMLLGSVPVAYRAALPVMEFFRGLPPPALIPFGILVFGLGDGMKVIVIATGCVWPILLNTIQGVRSVDPTYGEFSRVYRIPARDRLFNIILPAASPYIFAGLRSSMSIAVILMVLSEMTASTNGVGFFLVQSQRGFALPDMWAAILLLGILGCLLNALLVFAQRRLLAWHEGARGSALSQRNDGFKFPRRSGRDARVAPPEVTTEPLSSSSDRPAALSEVP